MPAISADKERRREYRERLWRSTPHPKLFPLSRLLVSITLSGSQSGFTVLRHRWNPNVLLPHVGVEMFWFIVVGIIVYMVIYALEWSWNYVALAPMIVDSDNQTKLKQSADEIATLTKENEGLKQAVPGVVSTGTATQGLRVRRNTKARRSWKEISPLYWRSGPCECYRYETQVWRNGCKQLYC